MATKKKASLTARVEPLYDQGYSAADIADELGITKSQAHGAISGIKKKQGKASPKLQVAGTTKHEPELDVVDIAEVIHNKANEAKPVTLMTLSGTITLNGMFEVIVRPNSVEIRW